MVTKVWERPEIYSIQVDLPQNPLRSLNVYVIRTPAGNLLIDTGFNRYECCAALWAGIRELELDLKKTSIFLTHFHSDHTGLAGNFVVQNCPIYMGRIDYEYLDGMKNGNNQSAVEELFRSEGFPEEVLNAQDRENQGRRYSVKQMFPAQLVDDGTVITLGDLEIQCVHTPVTRLGTWCFICQKNSSCLRGITFCLISHPIFRCGMEFPILWKTT